MEEEEDEDDQKEVEDDNASCNTSDVRWTSSDKEEQVNGRDGIESNWEFHLLQLLEALESMMELSRGLRKNTTSLTPVIASMGTMNILKMEPEKDNVRAQKCCHSEW